MAATNPKIRSLLGKIEPSSALPASLIPDEGDDEYVAFAHGRIGNRPQVSVTFRKADGSGKSFSYSYLYCVSFDDPNTGFIAEFSQTKIIVHGKNLSSLVRLISQHRVVEIIEAGRSHGLDVDDGEPVVERIQWK